MKKHLLIILFLFFVSNLNYGQKSDIHIPLNIQNAIEKGTRTLNGVPGDNYWQNYSDYKIHAELLADSSRLIGEEVITYYNNSPDSLKRIVVRLYQDIAKHGAVRDWYVGNNGLNDGVKINYVIIEGDTLDLSPQNRNIYRGSTNMIVRLNNKLEPSGRLNIKIGWEFEIPKLLKIRMGNYGDGNIYVAYWYPQIAVYDDIDGWDRVDYSGMVEFYNDFSNYDVTIKVPKGMVVWATGELQNGSEVFRKDIYEKYEKAKQSDETIRIITQDDYEKGMVTAENDFNEWRFTAKSVSDFSFATSTSFNWDGASVIVDKSSGRRSLTDVIYKEGTIHYDEGAQYARATIEYLSHELPGYPYPYSHATSYANGNRGGGMESPMMANNGSPSSLGSHVGLIFHEIAHNYFPFMMGNNERKYAWMDEGWAAFLPTDLVDKYDPEFDYRAERINSYVRSAGTESDLPLMTPSYSYKTKAMRLGFYDRPANAYYELNEYLGDKLFKEGMLKYMSQWIGRHPLPIDFFHTFNSVAGEDLEWFWKPWFYEFGYPDLSIKDLRIEDDFISVKVKKNGNIPTRVELVFEFEDDSFKSISKKISVWKDNIDEIEVQLDTSKKIKSIILGNKYIPDVNSENNIIKASN